MIKKININIDLQNATSHTENPEEKDFQHWINIASEEMHLDLEKFFPENTTDDASLDICIRLVDETESQKLNLGYRKKDKPTNILSFHYDEPPVLGDLVICTPIVKQEAIKQKKSLLAHFSHLTIHGFLHLLGYDHEKEKEAKIMEDKEIKILEKLNFPNPYF